jgi:predicted nucleotidyltransferase
MERLLRELREWAESDEAVAAVGLMGSHARGDARPDSDVDLVVLSSSPARLLEDRG